MNLVLFEPSELANPLPFSDERGRHVKKILKLKLGDTFRSGIVDGKLGSSKIIGIDNKSFQLFHHHEETPEVYSKINLIMGTPRPNSVKRVLREASALGIQKIFFVNTQLGEKSYQDSHVFNPQTTRDLLKQGASQAYCTRLPQINLCSMNEALDAIQNSQSIVFDNSERSVTFRATSIDQDKELSILIGSERGWTDQERDKFRKRGIQSSLLGARVLRSDTAFIAAISLAQYRMGLI